MADDDDPFGVFGDDEDVESDMGTRELSAADSTEVSHIAKSLVEQVNAKLRDNVTAKETQLEQGFGGKSLLTEGSDDVDLSHLRRVDLGWPQPLYLGPMILASSLAVGGGRGYVASRTLEPGTLVLVEEPVATWPEEQLGQKLDMVSVQHLLEDPNAIQILHDMEEFHPTKENVDYHSHSEENIEQISNMMKTMSSEVQERKIQDMLHIAEDKGIRSRNGKPLQSTDIMRLLLALRYNGLESGIYRHVAMLNHDCHPNCAKLLPSGKQTFSEVRTTRKVEAGEDLTISYVPNILSHASRRKYLWEHHRFDIGADLKGAELKMELVGNELPQSNLLRWDDASPAHRIESATKGLEEMLTQIQDDIKDGTAMTDSWETLKALEQSSLELYQESILQLRNDGHLLLIPILLVHIESCHNLLLCPTLSSSVHQGILSRQVLSSYRLLTLQTSNSGSDHFDLARTNLDLANGIGELLSRSPKKLYELSLPSLGTFAQWSALEHRSRRSYDRIKSLYPHDAEEAVNEQQRPR